MSSHLKIKLRGCFALPLQKCLQFQHEDTVWLAKQRVISTLAKVKFKAVRLLCIYMGNVTESLKHTL